jgi:hypothetical protein
MLGDALASLSEHYLQAFRCEIISGVRLSLNLGGSPQPIRRRKCRWHCTPILFALTSGYHIAMAVLVTIARFAGRVSRASLSPRGVAPSDDQ